MIDACVTMNNLSINYCNQFSGDCKYISGVLSNTRKYTKTASGSEFTKMEGRIRT